MIPKSNEPLRLKDNIDSCDFKLEPEEVEEDIDSVLHMASETDKYCNIQNIQINNTGVNIGTENLGDDDDFNVDF